ncbi:MAG: hypothetical protein GX060_04675 [Firmicutes bacterium]|nr:hypothetical protein [Bacillota bacterium]
MLLWVLGGAGLLMAWILWVLYITTQSGRVTVSLVFRVEQAENYLDPFLRTVCWLFKQVNHLALVEVWILAVDDGEEARSIVHRLQRTHPYLRFRSEVADVGTYLSAARGQAIWLLDLIEHNTPITALKVLERMLTQTGPMPPGTVALVNSPT